MSSFLSELKRRNVFRVAAAYAVVAWVLIQIGEAVFPAFGVPDALFRGMVILLLLGFPAALVFAWAFEKTPEGIKLERNVDRSQSITRETGRKLDRMIIAALAVAVVVLLLDKLLPDAPAPAEPVAGSPAGQDASAATAGQADMDRKSVAVLPFADMSAAGDQEYFSDGLADSLLHALAQVRDLKVAARTSSFAFKGRNQDIREIGRQLGVGAVLEGSVQKSGNRLRVITQLIDVQDGAHLWSETFDRTDEDIFAIQDEISAAVVRALQVSLGGEEARRLSQRATSDIQAFDLYLLGRHEFEKRDRAALEKAVAHFERAVAADPDYALAYTGLADSWMFLSRQNYGNLSIREAGRRARPYLDRALALAPDSSEVHASLGLYLDEFRQPGDFPGMTTISVLEKAVELNPANVLALTWLAIRYQGDGQYRKSFEVLRRAYELDPLNTNLLLNMSWWTMMTGDSEEAWHYASRTQELEPGSPRQLEWAAVLAYFDGKLDRSLGDSLQAQQLAPENPVYMSSLAEACMVLGDAQCANDWMQRAKAVAPGDRTVVSTHAELRRRQGDLEGAAGLLEQLLDQSLAESGDWGAMETRFAAVALAGVRLQQGRFAESAALYEKVFPTLAETLGRNDVFNARHLLNLAWDYRSLEQSQREQAALAEAGRRVRDAREGGRSTWVTDLLEAALRAQSGDTVGAEVLFARAVEGGYPGDWDRENLRLGELLGYSDAYRSVMTQVEERLAAQRAAVAKDLALARARAAL